MSSSKRKATDIGLQRRVRARREESEDIEKFESESNIQDQDEDGSSGSSDEEENQGQESDSEPEPEDAALISFGALAKAEASISGTKRKKAPKPSGPIDAWTNAESEERKAGRKDHRDFNRSSKHAPTEISSKKAVSRRREVIPIPKIESRDPRFDAVHGLVDEKKIRKNYDFLDKYRDDEMKELRERIKKEKNEDQKERLKRQLLSMESRKKAQDRKDKAEEVLSRHRKEEKELVKQGKKPFYLKDGELKKKVLVETFSGMKGKQVDRVIERRRKKVEGKEKKKMPWARREVAQ